MPADDRRFRIEPVHVLLELFGVQFRPTSRVEVGIAEAFRVAAAAAHLGQLVEPAYLVSEALVPEAVRRQRQNSAYHLPAEDFGQCGVVAYIERAIVPIVPPKELVPTITSKRHLHVAAGETGKVVEASAQRVGGLVEVIDQFGQESQQVSV